MCRATRVRLPRAATGPTSTRRRCRSTGKRTGRRAQFGLQPRPSGSGSAPLVARRSAATLAWGPARVASRAPPAQGSYDRERSCRRQYGRGTRARGAAEWERAGGTGGRNSGESETSSCEPHKKGGGKKINLDILPGLSSSSSRSFPFFSLRQGDPTSAPARGEASAAASLEIRCFLLIFWTKTRTKKTTNKRKPVSLSLSLSLSPLFSRSLAPNKARKNKAN